MIQVMGAGSRYEIMRGDGMVSTHIPMCRAAFAVAFVFTLMSGPAFAESLRNEYELVIKARKQGYEQQLDAMQSAWAGRLEGIWGEVLTSTKLFEREYTESAASEIDLATGLVRVTGVGIGIKPEGALDEALLMAVRGMKRTLMGLRLEGYMTLGDAIRRSGGDWESRLESFVNKNLFFGDDDIEVETRDIGYMVKVTVSIHLSGRGGPGEAQVPQEETALTGGSVEEFSQGLFVGPEGGEKKQENIDSPAPGVGEVLKPRGLTTGLILDARGTGYLPCMHPSVMCETGRVIYGRSTVSLKALLDKGSVAWAGTIEEARAMQRAGKRPIVIVPEKISCNNEMIISRVDFDDVSARDGKSGFLAEARVVIVLGDD